MTEPHSYAGLLSSLDDAISKLSAARDRLGARDAWHLPHARQGIELAVADAQRVVRQIDRLQIAQGERRLAQKG